MDGRYVPSKRYPVPSSYDKRIVPVQDKCLKYLYFMDREHPLADRKGRVLHHRHVASVKLGRWLRPKEVAHHKDEDRANNRASNLVVKSKRRHAVEHAVAHGKHELKAKLCGACRRKFKPDSIAAKYCSAKCFGVANSKAAWPSDAKLAAWLRSEPATHVAKALGVSSSAVKKRCRARGISTPPRGSWTKRSWERG